MYINSDMSKKIKIVLFVLCGYIFADISPEHGSVLNYTQVFFRWNQIPHATNYTLSIQNIINGQNIDIETPINSKLVSEFIDWDSNYIWFICGDFSDNETPFCSEIYNFTTNQLPDYFPNTDNLFIDETLYQDGITVMDFEAIDFSGGIDQYGNPLWFVDKNLFDVRFTFTHFLSNGNVIGFEPLKGYEIDLNGNIIFETPDDINSLHHDFIKTPQNTYMIISAIIEDQYCPEECNASLPNEIPWQGDIFREFDMDGNEVWSWNTFDYYDLTEYNPYYAEIYNGNFEMDWTHSNSVFFDKNSESVFISARNLSRITKIDYASKNLVWNMGETDFMNEIYFTEDLDFSQQHSVQVLDNGNLLFFDNHRYLVPELSRCIEVSYDESDYSVEIVWEHVLPIELFTGSRGECDRLNNGNTLITAGRSGHILEVTPDNETAWHLEYDNSGVPVSSYRSERIPNLYPVAFSLSIDEYIGDVENPIVEPYNNAIAVNIDNSGWAEGYYIYNLLTTSDTVIISDSVFVSSYENVPFSLDINIPGEINYTLEVYPSFAPGKIQTLEFTLNASIFLGDMNNDGTLNILDVVILVNLILSDDSSNPSGDVNQDGTQNILDLVILVNNILGN